MATTLKINPALLHLLLSFSDGPMHGYAAMQDIEDRTGGRVRLGPSSLYYALGRLEDAGLIEPVKASGSGSAPHEEQRRYYRLTPAGRRRLRSETRLLADIVSHARARGYLG